MTVRLPLLTHGSRDGNFCVSTHARTHNELLNKMYISNSNAYTHTEDF
jgi:hypothetical protein